MTRPLSSRLAVIGSLSLVFAAAPACKPSQPPGSDDVSASQPFGERCDEASASQQPDLMGLSMDFRANVSATSQQGVLAVSYGAKGCEIVLEVLPNCIGSGRYSFSAYPGNETKLVSSKTELFAKLPLGAAALEGKLAQGRSLRTDYRFAGMMTLPIGEPYERGSLRGQDCERATHIVNRIYVGGFALVAGKTQEIGAAATVFGVGAGGGNAFVGETVSSEGLAQSCQEAQAAGVLSAQCQVPLRLGLQAIAEHDPDAYAPDSEGFVPLLVIDEHHCRANEEVWNGTRCESLSTPKLQDLYFRDEHGCVMGKEVYYAAQGKCVPAEGHEIWNDLSFSPQQ